MAAQLQTATRASVARMHLCLSASMLFACDQDFPGVGQVPAGIALCAGILWLLPAAQQDVIVSAIGRAMLAIDRHHGNSGWPLIVLLAIISLTHAAICARTMSKSQQRSANAASIAEPPHRRFARFLLPALVFIVLLAADIAASFLKILVREHRVEGVRDEVRSIVNRAHPDF